MCSNGGMFWVSARNSVVVYTKHLFTVGIKDRPDVSYPRGTYSIDSLRRTRLLEGKDVLDLVDDILV